MISVPPTGTHRKRIETMLTASTSMDSTPVTWLFGPSVPWHARLRAMISQIRRLVRVANTDFDFGAGIVRPGRDPSFRAGMEELHTLAGEVLAGQRERELLREALLDLGVDLHAAALDHVRRLLCDRGGAVT